MEGIDLSKENEIAIMENVVSKYLPENNLIYEHNKGIFRLITSDKRFGIIFRGKFWRENIRKDYSFMQRHTCFYCKSCRCLCNSAIVSLGK